MCRHVALFKHYGIEPKRPGALLKLAEALADRHERDRVRRAPPLRLSAVFDKRGIDPETEGAHLALVIASSFGPASMCLDLDENPILLEVVGQRENWCC
jgi:hypothetical protein